MSNESESKKKFSILQENFRDLLPSTISDIERLMVTLEENHDEETLKQLHDFILYLADAAGTYGADSVSEFARKLDLEFKSLVATDNFPEYLDKTKDKINEWLQQLRLVAEKWCAAERAALNGKKTEQKKKSNVIYTLLGDEVFLDDLRLQLEKNSYRVIFFKNLMDLKKSYAADMPAVIIVDADYNDGGSSGVETVADIKNYPEIDSPVIYIANSTEAELRLKATRAGADRYFCKPVILNKIIHTINGLSAKQDDLPYRVLIVDNDAAILECYEAILTESNITVKTITDPLKTFFAIEKFKPDVTVIDMSMPECSGTELVHMIRQDDRWVLMPILFLSAEQNINNQLQAMSLGADDFITKPVHMNKLVAVINATAKRARNNVKLNRDLKNSLRENKYQLVTLDEHAIVSATDVAGRIIHVNDKLCEISGYTREELIGNNHRLLKSDHHDDDFYRSLWNTISSGKIWHGVICNFTKEGDEYWVDSTIVPFMDEKGNPYKYVSVRTDMTELRTSERRLKRSQEFASIGSWDWNIVTGDLFWSDLIWPLLGFSKNLTKTTYENFMAAIHPDDQTMVVDAITNCVQQGEDYSIEHRVVWPDGSEHWVHESGDVVRNKNGIPQHMLGVVRDITELKKAEKNIIAAREEAENANLAKSQFLSSMSHELRTPMNAIMGFSQLLKISKTQPLLDAQSKNVDEIIVAGKHLMSLINEVLDLAKIESGHIDLSVSKVILSKVIAESLQLISPLALKRGIEILLEKDGEAITIDELTKQDSSAWLDETRLKQVVLNLMSNAVKYNNENGKIKLACNDIGNDFFRISVTDTGNGLSEKQQRDLFKVFNRLGLEQTEIEGTGIGLVITKKIIELMGGCIGIDSEVGVGSTFWIELPKKQNKPDDKNIKYSEKISAKLKSTEDDMSKSNQKRTILYIEDNPANLRLVEQILQSIPNLKMWSAPEPLLGLELAMEHLPDLILLDINLPGMDGYEVLNNLRNKDASREIPVIAISANAMPKDIEKGKREGFDGYITKPVNVKELLAIVENKLFES